MRLCMHGRHDRRTKKRIDKAKRRERIITRMFNMRRRNKAAFKPLTWADLAEDAKLVRGQALDTVTGMDALRDALREWREGDEKQRPEPA